MKIGCPVLRVRNIDKVLAFYKKNLRLHVSTRYHIDDGNGDLVCELKVKHRSSLSTNGPLLIIRHDPNAKMPLKIQQDSFILPSLFLIERVLPRPIWQSEILEYAMMDLPIT
jgi:hypothetical protein